MVRLPVTLPAGVSRLEFVCPALPGAPAVDKGVFPVALGKAKLEPAE